MRSIPEISLAMAAACMLNGAAPKSEDHLTPGRATQLLKRGREYRDSRWICGPHSESAVEASRRAGAAIFAAG